MEEGDGPFDEIDLRNADLSGARLTDADLSEAVLVATLEGANFAGTDLTGVETKEENLGNADDLTGAEIPPEYDPRG